jgi:DNA polymerase III delta prime subunit
MEVAESDLPYMIAVPWSRLERLESTGAVEAERFEALVAVHTGILQTLALYAVSSYVERGPRGRELDETLRSRLLGKPLSVGDWADLVDRVLEAYRKQPDRCAVPALVPFWFRASGKRTAEAESIASFVRIRNDWAHGKLSDEGRSGLFQRYRRELESSLRALSFLQGYELLVPLRAQAADEGRVHVDEAVSCRGTSLARRPIDVFMPAPIEVGEELVLVEAANDSVLRLFPLVLSELGTGGRDDLLVYERNRRANGSPGTIVRLDYVGVGTRAQVTVDRHSSAAFVLPLFAKRFAGWLTGAGGEKEELAQHDAVFRAMPELVEAAAKEIVGREELFQTIAAHTASARGQVLLLLGPPGLGKTTALAALSRRLDMIAAVHLASASGGRDDPRLIARSLLAQLSLRFRISRPIPDGYGEALKIFHETLAELGEGGERLAVVIDALDEIRPAPDGSPDVALIPDPVPPGVLFVVSSRPGDAARSILSRSSTEAIELTPLSEIDSLELAKKVAPEKDEETLKAACGLAEGNPLFLKAVLLLDEGGLPSRIEEAFSRALRRAPPGVDAERALLLLAIARFGLSRRDLARALQVSPYTAGKLLEALGPLLSVDGERFSPFHARFREWIGSELADRERLRAAHAQIADLLRSDLASGRVDALLHLPHHLEQADRYVEVLELIDSGLVRRIAAESASLEAAKDALAFGVRAAGLDLVRAAAYGLTAALVVRGLRSFARAGVIAALARHGDLRVASAIARSVSDPDDRDRALAATAIAVVEIDPDLARRLAEEVRNPARRKEAQRAVAEWKPFAIDNEETAPVLERPEEEAARLAAQALAMSPGEEIELVLRAARAALETTDRSLRVRTLVQAAAGLEGEAARALAERAAGEAMRERSVEVRAPLIADAARVLARFDAARASVLCDAVPRGPARIRALLSATLVDRALAEAGEMPAGPERDGAFADIVEEIAARDPARALSVAKTLKDVRAADRAHLAIVVQAKREDAASAIADPGLRAWALAILGRFDEAESVLASISGREALAAAHERIASAALERNDAPRARRHRKEAEEVRDQISDATQKAAALREAAALSVNDERHALAALDEAVQHDSSYDARLDATLRRARILLARPSGENVRQAIASSASAVDVFADLYPDYVGALSESFGKDLQHVVLAAIDALAFAEEAAGTILAAGLRIDPGESEAKTAPRLQPQDAHAIATRKWLGPVRRTAAPKPEIDRLERQLKEGSASKISVDRLVELHLARGNREGAVNALLEWAARSVGDSVADAQIAVLRALEIDPLSLDPTLAGVARKLREDGTLRGEELRELLAPYGPIHEGRDTLLDVPLARARAAPAAQPAPRMTRDDDTAEIPPPVGGAAFSPKAPGAPPAAAKAAFNEPPEELESSVDHTVLNLPAPAQDFESEVTASSSYTKTAGPSRDVTRPIVLPSAAEKKRQSSVMPAVIVFVLAALIALVWFFFLRS